MLELQKFEVKRVKKALREMLKLARNVVLEKAFLFQMRVHLPPPVPSDSFLENSPFLIHKNVNNRSVLVTAKAVMKKGLTQGNQTPTDQQD